MTLFDLLGRNWTMGIIWHLNDSFKSFNDLENLYTDISPTKVQGITKYTYYRKKW
ncbi:hypothetical protein [Tenacibaculum sp. nBUS_03]|uniref:hypothetical protein n=1 Tax=Tenacibaculum sp. nBUS_03 TaxID=3395320 RepID=UPI003EBE2E88